MDDFYAKSGWPEYFGQLGGALFPFPDIAGSYRGRSVVICADGHSVWDDLEALGGRHMSGRGSVQVPDHDLMVINKLGEIFPGNIEHWYSNEGQHMELFLKSRRREYRREFITPKHTHSCNKGAKHHWPWAGRGTSGLGAVLTALALGYDQIIIAGMPLDNGPHNGEPPWRQTRFMNEAGETVQGRPHTGWDHAIKTVFKGKVKPMGEKLKKWIG